MSVGFFETLFVNYSNYLDSVMSIDKTDIVRAEHLNYEPMIGSGLRLP